MKCKLEWYRPLYFLYKHYWDSLLPLPKKKKIEKKFSVKQVCNIKKNIHKKIIPPGDNPCFDISLCIYKYVLYISLDNLLKNYVFPSNMRTIFSASWMKEKNGIKHSVPIGCNKCYP